MRRQTILWAWFWLVVAAALLVAAAAGWTPPRDEPLADLYAVLWFVPALFTGLGVMVAAKQPGNRIYLLFLVVGFAMLVSGWADFNVGLDPPDPVSISDALAVIGFNTAYTAGVMIPLLLLMFVFPTGRFLSRRWSWAGWAAGVAAATVLFSEAFAAELTPYFDPESARWTIENPFGFLQTATMQNLPYVVILGATVIPLLLGGVASLIARYRRSSASIRAQIRWIVYALFLFVLVGVLPALIFGIYGVGLIATMLLIPVAVTVAITRYRLFDIDRLISRTVSYTIVVGVLAVTYFGAVTLITTLLPPLNSLAVAGATLVAAALFNPLRRRIQHAVDRRFNRSAYEVEVISEEFAARLRESHTVDELTRLWASTVIDHLQPTTSGVWISVEDTK